MVEGIMHIKWNNTPIGEKLHQMGYKYLYEVEEEEKSIFALMSKNETFRVYLHVRSNHILTIETESANFPHTGTITHNYTFDRKRMALQELKLISMMG